jgi:hypothetical protein
MPIPLPAGALDAMPAFEALSPMRLPDARPPVAALPPQHARTDELADGALLRFKTLMNGEGLVCDLARLCDDRHYAYERIAAAHATANEGLRRLALELFQIYHRPESASRSRQ